MVFGVSHGGQRALLTVGHVPSQTGSTWAMASVSRNVCQGTVLPSPSPLDDAFDLEPGNYRENVHPLWG